MYSVRAKARTLHRARERRFDVSPVPEGEGPGAPEISICVGSGLQCIPPIEQQPLDGWGTRDFVGSDKNKSSESAAEVELCEFEVAGLGDLEVAR